MVSLDVPTGLDSDSGFAHDERRWSPPTVCMGALKSGLVLGDGPEYAGEVGVVDIGIPPTVLADSASAEGSGWLIGDASVAGLLPERPRGAHKFSVGQLAVVAGSDAYSGAAVLASRAAGRVGAGYVMAFSSAAACAAIDAQAPEVCTVPIPTDHEAAAALVRARGDRASALLIGPGLEGTEASDSLVRELLATGEGTAVIDAGALGALVPWIEGGDLKERADERWVLTPHPGELARLIDSDADLEDAGAIERGRALAARWGCVLVLKGAPTLVCDPAGAVFVAGDAPTSLATAGSGDVLAGTIGGLLAQGLDPLDAALAGVHLGLGAARPGGAWRRGRPAGRRARGRASRRARRSRRGLTGSGRVSFLPGPRAAPEHVTEGLLHVAKWAKGKSIPSRADGFTRTLARSISSACSAPSARRIAKAGAGTTVGRRSVLPSALVKEALVTSPGATRLTGPRSRRVVERRVEGADRVVECDPGEPLLAAAEPAARAQLEGGEHRVERSSPRVEHHAEAAAHLAHVVTKRGDLCLPRLTRLREETGPRRGGLREDLVAAVPVHPDRRRGHQHLGRPLHGVDRGDDRARPPATVRDARFFSTVQRRPKMLSPARWTIPSTPSRAATSTVPAAGSQRTSRRARRGARARAPRGRPSAGRPRGFVR